MRPRILLGVSLVALSACARPCESPIRYRAGVVDERFAVSERELLSALRRAEAVWEDAAHRDLFRDAEDGELSVNLVFDARQMTTQEIARRTTTIEKAGDRAEEARTRYRRAKAKYETVRKDYEAAQASHEARLAKHNRSVQAWNAKGGGSAAQQQALQREATAIESSAATLEETRLSLNSLASRANDLSESYNELVDEVNDNVTAVNTTAGREFKQGRYTKDSTGLRIDVFEFRDRDDLVHVLAHEMGHALGLEHNDNPQSIMYGLNSSRTAVLTVEDLAAMRELCGL